MRLVPTLIALLLAATLAAACSSPPPDTATPVPDTPTPVPTPTPTVGEQVFGGTCAVCHGAGGEGQPDWHIRSPDGTLPAPPLNGDGHTWHHADGLLFRIVYYGGQLWEDPSLPQFKSNMPAFGEQLTPNEIVAVLEYVKGLWGDKESRGVSIVEHQAMVSGSDPFPPLP